MNKSSKHGMGVGGELEHLPGAPRRGNTRRLREALFFDLLSRQAESTATAAAEALAGCLAPAWLNAAMGN